MHELETTKNFIWPKGVCVSDADPQDMGDPTNRAFVEYVTTRSMELARRKLLTPGAQDVCGAVILTWYRMTPAEREAYREPDVFADWCKREIHKEMQREVRRRAHYKRHSSIQRRDPKALGTTVIPQVRDLEVKEAATLCKALLRHATRTQVGVLELAYMDGLSNEEIAEKMQISTDTVKSHRRDGLRRVRENGGDQGVEP